VKLGNFLKKLAKIIELFLAVKNYAQRSKISAGTGKFRPIWSHWRRSSSSSSRARIRRSVECLAQFRNMEISINLDVEQNKSMGKSVCVSNGIKYLNMDFQETILDIIRNKSYVGGFSFGAKFILNHIFACIQKSILPNCQNSCSKPKDGCRLKLKVL
jgi:hypothetical protein